MSRRREIADRVLAKYKARGYALDAIPGWTDLVNLWVDRTIDGAEMHQRYLAELQPQAGSRDVQRVPKTPGGSMLPTIGIDPDAEPAPATLTEDSQ